jgi:uncharacterized membrane protein YdjX (TVP38/TMEM64 family)
VVTLGVLYRDALSVELVRQQLDQFGAWAPVVFMLTHYVAATLLCMIPGALAYVWIGHAGAEAIAGGERAIQAVLIAIGLLAMAIFLPRLVRRIRRESVPGLDDLPDEREPR